MTSTIRHPAAYLRNSKDPGTKDEHHARLMTLVHADGHNGDSELYDDWNRSGGRAGLGKRTAYARLCADIEANRISAVYMNALDRGGRDLEEWLRFVRIAIEHGTGVIDPSGDWTAPDRRDEFESEVTFAGREYRKAVKRSAGTKAMQVARGDTFGHPPYGRMILREEGTRRVVHVPNPEEPIEPILDAIRETRGNVLAACRLLNASGSVARYGRSWSPRTLANIIRREAPQLLRVKATTRTSRKDGELRQPSPLSRLVKCHCGHLMTPRDSGGLYCNEAIKVGPKVHGRYVARQRHVYALLQWLTENEREVKWFRNFSSADPDPADARREELTESLRRLGRAYADGAYDDEEYGERREPMAAELARLLEDAEDSAADREILTTQVRAVGPLVNWAADDTTLGDELRRVFRSVTLDWDMLPTDVEWRVK
jgi:DNA invertase Pin-like site-specific DNA recombinase